MLVENPYADMGLSDMLDRWRSYVIDAGADVGDVGPGLSTKEIRQMESKVGFEFVPQVVEFLSWGVCTHRYGSRFFPTPGTWSSPRRIVADTIGLREHSLVELCKEMGEEEGIAAGSDDELLRLWSDGVAYAVDHHRDGPTLGGLWCIDEGCFTGRPRTCVVWCRRSCGWLITICSSLMNSAPASGFSPSTMHA